MTFYVPFPEADALTALAAVETGGAGDAPANPMTTYISIAAIADGTIICYDHWEDGYEADHNYITVHQATTEIWGDGNASNGAPPGIPSDLINAGTVVLLYNQVNTTSPQTLDFDARDKIAALRTISVTRTYWAAQSGTLFAGCVETFDTSKWGKEYRAPIGVDVPDGTDYQMFEYTAISVMARDNDTTVLTDADNNGTFEATNVLNEGETIFVSNVNVGGRVLADKPLQAVLFSGDIASNYESRDSSLLPVNLWSSNYYTPVSTPSGHGTRVWLYNPGAADITVNYTTRLGTGTPVNGSLKVTAGSYNSYTLANGAAGRFYTANGAVFYAYSTTDSDSSTYSSTYGYSDNQSWDWSYTLIPEQLLSPQVLIGLGIGRDPTSSVYPSENGNPIWITPVGNGSTPVTVYIDYDGDNAGPYTDANGNRYDASTSLVELQQAKLYDPDGDQTAMLIYVLSTNVTLAAAWGQDTLTATAGAPGLDVGTSIPPVDVIDVVKDLSVTEDANGDGVLGPEDTAEYRISVNNTSRAPIPADVIVRDVLDGGLTYVAGSTEIRNSTNSAWTSVSDDTAGTPFPLDGDGLLINDSIPVNDKYQVRFLVAVAPFEALADNQVSMVNTGTVSAVVFDRVVSFRNETYLHGAIGDRIWYDTNGDGAQDAGEPGINGVVVYLDMDNDGVRDECEPYDTTAGNGDYLLTGAFIVAGTCHVRVDASTLPAGLSPTYDLDGVASTNLATCALAGGEERRDLDFGYRAVAQLSGSVFRDVDGDGTPDAEDTAGLAGVTVLLLDATSNVVSMTSTSPDGSYVFANVPTGTYSAVQILPSGWTNTYDVVPPNDLRIPLMLTPNQNSTNNDFYDTRSGTPASAGKVLYLSDPSQALDRNDPVASGDNTTASTATLTQSATETITVVGAAASANSDNTVSTFSFSYDSGSTGQNRVLMVGISYRNRDSETVTSVTYGGQTMTEVGTAQVASRPSDGRIYIFSLVNPPTGANSLRVNWNSALNYAAVVGAVTYAGVDQTTPTGSFASSSATFGTPAVNVGSASSQLLFGVCGGRTTSDYAVTDGGTQLWSARPYSRYTSGSGQSKAGATSVSLTWSGSSAAWVAGGVALRPATSEGTRMAGFTQSPAFALPFSMSSGATVSITGFVDIVSGTMPANPAVTARLSAGGTTFMTLSNPTYSGGALVWSETLGGNISLPTGQAIALSVSNAQAGVDFALRYDSAAYPSKVVLPTASIIAIPSLAIYDAPYPGGAPVADSPIPITRYVRLTVTDPFGAYDITGASLAIDGPGTSGDLAPTLGDGDLVASNAWSKTYEFAWDMQANDGDYTIAATANEGSEGITASGSVHHRLYYPPIYAVGGQVRDDFDIDGDLADPDLPSAGVAIRLYSDPNGDGDPADGDLLDMQVTDDAGVYLFENLANAHYVVVESDPVYSVSTADIYGAPDDNRIAVTIANADSLGNDFLDAVDPSGYLYDTHDGLIVPGGSVAVTGPGDVTLVQDGSSGQYIFVTDGTPGSYTIAVTPPSGYIIDPRRSPAGASFDPTGGDDPTVLGAYPRADQPGYLVSPMAESNAFYYAFELTNGDPIVINNNFPLTRFDQIGDFAWEDADGDGFQDAGELPLENVVVQLYDATSNLLDTATTDAFGAYRFTNLTAAIYFVRFTPPSGYAATPADAGSEDASDSDADASGWTRPIALLYGVPNFSVDAGFYRPARVYGYIFYEDSPDGIRDAGDIAVTNIGVYLMGTNGAMLAETVSDASGYYSFEDVLPGNYTLRFWVRLEKLTLTPAGDDPERNRIAAESEGFYDIVVSSGDGLLRDGSEPSGKGPQGDGSEPSDEGLLEGGSGPYNVGLTGNGPLATSIALRMYKSAEG
ncbi:MAG: SdrD B-like domain-containing protein, partial [Kiritimatiellae bacterium]|nr:SdrD B-like domain-containing protein [Kiritimatiellia bacterium]